MLRWAWGGVVSSTLDSLRREANRRDARVVNWELVGGKALGLAQAALVLLWREGECVSDRAIRVGRLSGKVA